MLKWYLVLNILNNGPALTTIPQPYNDYQQCQNAGNDWIGKSWARGFACIRAPEQTDTSNERGVCTNQAGVTYPCVPTHKDKYIGHICPPEGGVCTNVERND